MFALSGYAIEDEIHENNRIRVFRGRRAQDGSPVIIKALKEEAAGPAGISRLLYEYEITRDLDTDGISKPVRLEQEGMIFALVMEDSEAISLRQYMQGQDRRLETMLDIAVQLAKTLAYLHKKGVIHRDLKPENILIHPGTKRVQIIDFGASVLWQPEKDTAPAANLPVGTLQYMPPEQTGRLGRTADFRSDLYALGIVFYELLTGRLPWQAENSMGWMHAHIALKPELPEKINPDIPPAVTAVLMKLLAKTAEERYQSAHGLLQDLEKCRDRLCRTGKIEPFPPGREDIPPCLRLPRRLYGRQREAERLRTAFADACNGQRGTVFISGYAGMGKTVLVQEAVKAFPMNRGYFIAGKFDQLRKNIPYAPFAAAFGNLVKQLMTESEKELDHWKKRLLGALGRNGVVITEIIPELEWIIGKQVPGEVLPPQEAQNRFLLVFRDFVRVFARKGRPLVLFLDDLQWVDPASLDLFQYLIRDADLNSLLLIGAFRENEVGEEHLLASMLEESRKEKPQEQHIFLMPLDGDQAAEYVAEALQDETKKTAVLAEALYRKSCGNPLFLGQLLMLVYDQGFLYFDSGEGFWKWKLEAIHKLQPGEDVLALFSEKLQRLPEETREIMKLAACIGNGFDLQTLAAVSGRSTEETASCLTPAIREGLVLTASDQKELPAAIHSEIEHPTFEFLHDRVQQAVYSLIPEGEKQEKHLAIGRLLLQGIIQNRSEEKILPVMDHFNRSLELLHDPAERAEIAGYNLLAGRKAKASGAYASALRYFRAGRTLLPEAAWERAYQLCYELHMELAQMEYLSANAAAAEALFDTVMGKAGTELERMEVYALKVVLLAGMGKYSEAVQTGIAALAALGIKLPVPPGRLDYARELLLYRWVLNKYGSREQAGFLEAGDAVQMVISELLVRLACIISIYDPRAYVYTIIKFSNHAVRYGNTDMAAIGYMGYGIVTGSMFENYAEGYDLARRGLRLAEKGAKSYSKCYVNFVMGAIVSHWTQPAVRDLDYLNKAVRYGVEAGDLLLTGYACRFILETGYLAGHSLDKLEEEITREQAYAGRIRHEYLALNTSLYKDVVAFLKGETDKSFSFEAIDFDEDGFMETMKRDQASQAAYHILKMQLCFLSGDYRKASAAAEKAESRMEAVIGFMITAEFYFYYSLIITALYEELPVKDRNLYRKKLKKKREQLEKWSLNCKENYLHKYLLAAAETARLENRLAEAMALYDRAIQSARENGYIQNEALANELAARFYLNQGRKKIARTYMADACQGYSEWGAAAKAKALREQYTDLLGEIRPEEKKRPVLTEVKKETSPSGSGDSEDFNHPDLIALRRAIRNISEEADLGRMLEGFLAFAMESAGADRGILLLEKDGGLWVEAVKTEASQNEAIRPFPMEKSKDLSKAVVRYVFRTLETVVLNRGENSKIFARDPYVAQADIKSTACLPILFRGIPAGVIYLENSLLEGAFTAERLEILKLLSAQPAAIRKMQDYLEGKPEKTSPAAASALGTWAAAPAEPLTVRETEVLQLLARGMSNREIADRLGLTANTVKGYIKNIYGKLGAGRRVQVAARARELGLLNP